MVDKNQQLMNTVGRAIAKYRQAAGLTQAQLAERLGIGNDAVSRMERGNTVPSLLRLLELSEIFRCEIADLMTESSHRAIDQARVLEQQLNQLNREDRAELLLLLQQMIQWKLKPSN